MPRPEYRRHSPLALSVARGGVSCGSSLTPTSGTCSVGCAKRAGIPRTASCIASGSPPNACATPQSWRSRSLVHRVAGRPGPPRRSRLCLVSITMPSRPRIGCGSRSRVDRGSRTLRFRLPRPLLPDAWWRSSGRGNRSSGGPGSGRGNSSAVRSGLPCADRSPFVRVSCAPERTSRLSATPSTVAVVGTRFSPVSSSRLWPLGSGSSVTLTIAPPVAPLALMRRL